MFAECTIQYDTKTWGVINVFVKKKQIKILALAGVKANDINLFDFKRID